MDYIVNFRINYRSDQKVNAQAKAPADVTKTLTNLGAKEICLLRFNPLNYEDSSVSKLRGLGQRILDYPDKWLKMRRIKKGDRVFFQYHYPNEILSQIVSLCKKNGAEIHFIIHDIYSLRFAEKKEDEIKTLNSATKLFVHTEAMEQYLKSIGVTSSMCIMHLFDYYTEDTMPPIEDILSMREVVVFAGNINKSEFVYALNDNYSTLGFKLKIYGRNQIMIHNEDIELCGSFEPEHTKTVLGGWGLVWDGPSVNTCDGLMGSYLRINSSHKISLYLAQGIPLISWAHSSITQWLSQYNVCITIESLHDINEKIHSIDDSSYRTLVNNARTLGNMVRTGKMLKAVLDV